MKYSMMTFIQHKGNEYLDVPLYVEVSTDALCEYVIILTTLYFEYVILLIILSLC